MIVCDAGDSWQVVLQTDHAELAGRFAERWGNDGFAAPRARDSVVTASRRHDDGWSVWERAPKLDAAGRPCNFLDVHVPSHLAFWRACTAAVAEQDPYAGLLVSMHGAGIYRRRYGAQPSLQLTFAADAQELVDAFVSEQESGYAARRSEVGADEQEVQASYRFVQLFDRLSLFFCTAPVRPGLAGAIEFVPRDEAGAVATVELEAVNERTAAIDPYPFADEEVRLPLRRRLVPKQSWESNEAFRESFFSIEPETVDVVLVPRSSASA